MGDDQKPERPRLAGAQIAQFVFGIILFGVLMGLREESASVWVRMLVASCAAAVLGIFVLSLRKYRR